jgi:hypothetical protein
MLWERSHELLISIHYKKGAANPQFAENKKERRVGALSSFFFDKMTG